MSAMTTVNHIMHAMIKDFIDHDERLFVSFAVVWIKVILMYYMHFVMLGLN